MVSCPRRGDRRGRVRCVFAQRAASESKRPRYRDYVRREVICSIGVSCPTLTRLTGDVVCPRSLESPMAAVQLDAIALLKADHRKVENLFAKFETARKPKKQGLAQQICIELTIHTIIEEEIFYPACKGEIAADIISEA